MEITPLRPTHAEVDLDAIQQNVRALKACAPGAALMAVVKADGYGHGAIPVAQAALEAGATWLGVATLEEAVALRAARLTAPILVFGYVPPSHVETAVRHDLRLALFHLDVAAALSAAASKLGTTARVHIKVDTGMGRIGVRPAELLAFAQAVQALPGIEIEGIFTHLATADEPAHDYAAQQIALFDQALDDLKRVGITPRIRHTCNSAGIMLHKAGHYDMVRAGIAMYGLPPDPAVTWPVALRPALTWRTQIGMLKTVPQGTPISYGRTYHASGEERIASLPLGYADGYSRSLSNRGVVLIGGQPCPVVGRVCMDQTMVRLPPGLAAAVGDEVMLIGEQSGVTVSATDMAGLLGTINYEIVCAIGRRVPRIYRKAGLVVLTNPSGTV